MATPLYGAKNCNAAVSDAVAATITVDFKQSFNSKVFAIRAKDDLF